MSIQPQDVLKFWFEESTSSQWYKKDPEYDQLIRTRFASTLTQARVGALASWRTTAEGRLAEVIVLDQFSRNIYRDQGTAFDGDPVALVLAQEADRQKAHLEIDEDRRSFLFMPWMHSESRSVHAEAVQIFKEAGLSESMMDYELKHKKIVDRFGRYPHRNQVLGRESTAEEISFLKEKGSSF